VCRGSRNGPEGLKAARQNLIVIGGLGEVMGHDMGLEGNSWIGERRKKTKLVTKRGRERDKPPYGVAVVDRRVKKGGEGKGGMIQQLGERRWSFPLDGKRLIGSVEKRDYIPIKGRRGNLRLTER